MVAAENHAFLGAHKRGGDVVFFHGEFNLDAEWWLTHEKSVNIAEYYPPHWIAVNEYGKRVAWGDDTEWTTHADDLYNRG